MRSKMGHWGKVVVWSAGAFVLLTALVSVERSNARMTCIQLVVHIADAGTGGSFIDEQAVRQQLLDRDPSLLGTKLTDIDLPGMEAALENIPCVRSANVYHTMNGTVHVKVEQRVPLVRVISADGPGSYIDEEGWIMPLNRNHTARVLVATGDITGVSGIDGVRHITSRDSLSDNTLMLSIYNVARTIRSDPYWRAMFDHMVVRQDGQIELIPRIGGHRVAIGDGSELDTQLKKLKEFYHKGITQAGWRAYDRIDLRFTDQVVCTQKQ